ncbi:glycosyltransferase [Natronococcus pandeyae]|nr:glycosyltransferase [Natronococcus pandeyae]
MVEYSVGLTTYNCEVEARDFVNSFEVDNRKVELVVVDAGSNDETRDVFRQFEGPVQVETRDGCTRGEGRQHAVEIAQNDHIISEIDPDVQYSGLGAVLEAYEGIDEQNIALLVRGNNGLIVAPTTLLKQYHYRPIQYREDHALHDRLYKAGVLRVLGPPPSVEENGDMRVEKVQLPSGDIFVAAEQSKDMTPLERLSDWYRDVQAMYRIGFSEKQIFTHNIRTMLPHEIVITIPLTVVALLNANEDRYSDALAHCSDELYQPLRHECY